MNKIVTFGLLLLSFSGSSQRFILSDSATISVITCGPYGKELYAAFGHSAIRVNDPELKFDAAYNYGVFDSQSTQFLFELCPRLPLL
ncbi:MAG: DUF4105 domain-containing protein [Cytophagales bacterium]|nr:DUF4105 domain-containing protein [Cytophagales bacterium]